MPSILGRSHIMPAGQSNRRCIRHSPSLPILTSPVFDERAGKIYPPSNGGRPRLSKRSSLPSIMFQILSEADLGGGQDHELSYITTNQDPRFTGITSHEDSSCGASGADTVFVHRKHQARRRSTMSHIKAENNHGNLMQQVRVETKEQRLHSHSISSPSLFLDDVAVPTNPTTSLTSSMSDDNLQTSWGHYIDVTTVTEDLDRRIDLYRQRRRK